MWDVFSGLFLVGGVREERKKLQLWFLLLFVILDLAALSCQQFSLSKQKGSLSFISLMISHHSLST